MGSDKEEKIKNIFLGSKGVKPIQALKWTVEYINNPVTGTGQKEDLINKLEQLIEYLPEMERKIKRWDIIVENKILTSTQKDKLIEEL